VRLLVLLGNGGMRRWQSLKEGQRARARYLRLHRGRMDGNAVLARWYRHGTDVLPVAALPVVVAVSPM